MYKSVPLSKLKPNPFRRLDEYPIQREKVDAIKESIESTGFWGNIVAREVNGEYQIAYGHHRLVALQESLKKNDPVDVIVRKLTNEQMVQMMARENMEEYGTSAWVELETLRAVLDGIASGDITPPPVKKNTPKTQIIELRDGPRVVQYTKAGIAKLVGWVSSTNSGNSERPNEACDIAFKALEMLDAGFVKEADIRGLTRNQMKVLIQSQSAIYAANMRHAKAQEQNAEWAEQAAEIAETPSEKRRHEKKAEILRMEAKQLEKKAAADAKVFGKQIAEKVRRGELSVRDIRKEAEQRKPTVARQTAPDVDGLAEKTIAVLDRFANGDDVVSANMDAITKFSSELSAKTASSLARSFENARRRLEKMATKLECLV